MKYFQTFVIHLSLSLSLPLHCLFHQSIHHTYFWNWSLNSLREFCSRTVSLRFIGRSVRSWESAREKIFYIFRKSDKLPTVTTVSARCLEQASHDIANDRAMSRKSECSNLYRWWLATSQQFGLYHWTKEVDKERAREMESQRHIE